MPYIINKYSGQQIAVVADGTIDNTTDLKLIGKNYAGYGEVQNENFLFLLENFANSSQPPRPVSGQIWYDSGTSKLKFYDGTKFRTTGGAEVSATAPTGLTVGDFWFDTSNNQLYAWSDTGGINGAPGFVLIGPEGIAGLGVTQMRSRNVKAAGTTNKYPIIEAVVNDETVFIISPQTNPVSFELDTAVNPIDGFNDYRIQRGITLSNTPGTGQTSGDNIPGVTKTDHRFWGTATNSMMLNGKVDTDFITSLNAQFNTLVRFSDAGFTVGDTPKLRVFNTSSTTPTIQNQLNDTILIQTTTNGVTTYPLTIKGSHVLPGGSAGQSYVSDNVNDLGSTTARFRAVYSASFKGVADQADTLSVAGNARYASVASSPNTVVVRDSSSNISAVLFQGEATTARYADLAEKYLADAEYEVGTVVMVGGEKEVTAAQVGFRALGAVSSNPAYMMNSELEGGTYIALKGRVPVKVTGPVQKGQRLVAGQNGTAQSAMGNNADVFAIALESNQDAAVKLVECVIL